MERGILHAGILARITAPRKMIDACVAAQGKITKKNGFSIDDPIWVWPERYVMPHVDAA